MEVKRLSSFRGSYNQSPLIHVYKFFIIRKNEEKKSSTQPCAEIWENT